MITAKLLLLRRAIQAIALVFFVWGGAVVGHYLADKVSNALPALSCAYDPLNAGYCVLIPLQHQMHHRVGEMIVAMGQFSVSFLLPVAMTLLAYLAFYVVLGKAFCGWICPLGTVQDWLYLLARRFQLGVARVVPERALPALRPVKWLLLLGLIFALPLLAGLGKVPHELGDPFCQICPSRLITTWLSGNGTETMISTRSPVAMTLGMIGNALTALTLILSLTYRQPFCRICPLLALNAVMQRFALLQLGKKTAHERCARCGICTKACPMDIPEVSQRFGKAAFHQDCTLCGRCVAFCPDDDVLRLQFGPLALSRSDAQAYRQVIRSEKPDGSLPKNRKVWRLSVVSSR